MPPNPLMKLILGSCLAKAQAHHPIKVNHFLFEDNHCHLIVTVENPDDVPGFMERFKTESSHKINKLLGRTKRTNWCAGYDSPPVLTLSSVIDKIVYIYTNPSRDGLEKIDKYPGLSSWGAFNNVKKCEDVYPDIKRPMVPCLKTNPDLDRSKLARRFVKKIKSKLKFTVHPDAWMDTFQITEETERKALNEEIKERVRNEEAEHAALRKEKGSRMIGCERLVNSPMNTEYVSLKKGRRMLCISNDLDVRRATIEDIKLRRTEGKRILENWRRGDFTESYPLGLFPPSMPKVCEPYSSNGFALGRD